MATELKLGSFGGRLQGPDGDFLEMAGQMRAPPGRGATHWADTVQPEKP